jgi:hypothetical protein
MRWPWIRDARLIDPRPSINPKVLELQTAKGILAKMFHARPETRSAGDITTVGQLTCTKSIPTVNHLNNNLEQMLCF